MLSVSFSGEPYRSKSNLANVHEQHSPVGTLTVAVTFVYSPFWQVISLTSGIGIIILADEN